jgi:hypothetical protein
VYAKEKVRLAMPERARKREAVNRADRNETPRSVK